MSLQLLDFIAAQVDQLPALFAFAVKAALGIGMAVSADIFKTGGAVYIYDVFVYETFVDETFEPAVDRGLPDRRSLLPEIFAHIAGGNVNAPDGLEITKQQFPLLCLVLWP